MKCTIPEVSFHNREPVYSLDFQHVDGEIRRMATGGADCHVLIWYVTIEENGTVSLEIACDIRRHIRAVNIVRFSPNGSLLASGDDEAAIWLWTKSENNPADIFNEAEEQENKEHWTGVRMLRGHIDDIYDLCWSPDGNYLISGSIDNTAIVWNIQKGRSINILSDHKGFVQGVSWDPDGKFLATLSSDRVCRIYKVDNAKRVHLKVDKAVIPTVAGQLPAEQETPPRPVRLFHDDTFKSFFRRLTFTPDGELLIAPTGLLQLGNGESINTTYIFHRDSLNKPLIYLPSKDKPTVAVRCCPLFFTLRGKENTQSMFNLPYRMVFAVATEDAVLLYDTQQVNPFGMVSKIQYTRLSDMTWSKDGRILALSSTDGYCTFVTFGENELGMPFTEELPNYKEKLEIKKKKKNKKDALATPLKEDEKSPIPGCDSEIKTPKAQTATNTVNSASTQSIQPEQKRVQFVTLFSPKLKATIQVYKKNASGEVLSSTQTKKLEDLSAKKQNLEFPEDTVMEVDEVPADTNLPNPSTLATEDALDLKLILTDSEDEISVLCPLKELSDKSTTNILSDDCTLVAEKMTSDVIVEEKLETKPSKKTEKEESSITKDIVIESETLVDNVANKLPTLPVNSTPPRASSSPSPLRNVGTPPGSGIRAPRRVQLITLSASKKPKSTSENKKKDDP